MAPRRHRPFPIAVTIVLTGAVTLLAAFGCERWDHAQRDPGAAATRTTFDVEGLDCPVWCSVRLTEAIDGLDGARVDSIDRGHGRVVVRHDPARQSTTRLRALLQEHGFRPSTAR